MQVVNYTQFRTNLKATLDRVTYDDDTVIVSRGSDNDAVIISLREYNSIQETLHLLSSKNNRERLLRAIERDKKDEFETHQLITS
jgi:antitoxin YefM